MERADFTAKKFIPCIILLLAFASSIGYADPKPPMVIMSNNIVITTNEIPNYGPLFKKYPLINIIDKDVQTTWVYEGGESVPQIIVEIPDKLKIDKVGLVNGYSKSKTLYYDNNRIKEITLRYLPSSRIQKASLDLDALTMQYIVLKNEISGPATVILSVAKVISGKKYKDTCMSELDFFSDGNSLVQKNATITSSGGEYPDYELFIDGRSVAKFVDGVTKAFFIENGKFAVFKHGLGSQGVTVFNILNGRSVQELKDLEIISISWQDGYFIGIALSSDKHELSFKKKIQFP
jgi:hypothetical protein